MSRQAHLPPRCPFQKKPISRPVFDPISPPLHNESFPRHHKSSSQSSILEDQPAWLDELLSDSDANSKVIFHRRSASDSVTLLDSIVDSFSSLSPLNDEENSVGNETCSGLESACIYGPNSPRRRGSLTFSENSIVSALSEYVSPSPPQYVDGNLCNFGSSHSDMIRDELTADTKTGKRHSGQRSRVRKLQYIAELERTVNVFLNLESELAVRVASLLQQRAALSLENCRLKQQVAWLQQEKLKLEDQYQSLKKEAKKLKIGLATSPNRKVRSYSGSSRAAETDRSEVTWQMLDMANLNLN